MIYVNMLNYFFSFLLDYKFPESRKLIFTSWVTLYSVDIYSKLLQINPYPLYSFSKLLTEYKLK